MDNIDPTTKKIQKINLKTYKVFAEFCKKNKLKHFAISGTAIGAELWQGFIPWDDDMDIAMPIQDFEKLRKDLYKKLPSPYRFIELPELGGKIFNENTTLIEAPYTATPSHYYGVFIDIVPLVGIPDNQDERSSFILEIKRYIAEASATDRAPELKNFTGQNIKHINSWRQNLISKYPFGTTEYCTDLSCSKCPLYITRGFLKPSQSKFEDTTIPTSSHQSEDLFSAYGQLVKHVPAAERQLTHHNFYALCDLDKSYKEYAKKFDSQIPAWYKELSRKCQTFGISSAREAALYKNLCDELEKQIQNIQSNVKELRNSHSFRLGNFLLKPLSKIKTFIHLK